LCMCQVSENVDDDDDDDVLERVKIRVSPTPLYVLSKGYV